MITNKENINFGKLYFFKKNKWHNQYYSGGKNSNDFVGVPMKLDNEVIFVLEHDMIRRRRLRWWDLTELK